MNHGLKWFFSKNRLSSLIEAFGSPEKGWLLCVDLLWTDQFDNSCHFSPRRPPGGSGKSGRSGGRRPATYDSIAW